MIIDNIIEEIDNAKTISILTHEHPDGDAIGSSLALYHALKGLNKEVDVIIPEVPEIYKFLPGIEIVKKEGKVETYDLSIALDCGDINRLNGFAEVFENAKVRISIDHHGINTMFADYNFINPTAPACAQILITVIQELGIEINKEIGTCLLTGIITDTGGFKYPATTAETFEFTAELINQGINVSEIYKRVLQTVSKEKFNLRKIATNRLELLEDDQIAFTYITMEDVENTNSTQDDYDGIVEIGRDIEGVEISIFLKEIAEGSYKISLRSNDYVNVADICLMFNGGGHARAAGGSITGTIEEAKERIIEECKKHLAM